MTSRLFTKYKEEVLPRLQKQFNYKNIMQTPGLVKVVVNIGVNEAKIRSVTSSTPGVTHVILRS